MKVGIPKGLVVYNYPILYENFFKLLGVEVVYSENTNKKIVEDGIKYSIDETCLASKIFLGHVKNLIDRKEKEKIDYIFIPRIAFFGKKDTVCVKFYAQYDICKNTFNSNFICLNVDYSKGMTEFKAFLKLGLSLGFKYKNVVSSYIKARNMQRIYDNTKYKKQIDNLKNSDSMNILVVAHPYVIFDEYIGKPILSYLKESNVNVCFASINKYTNGNVKLKNAEGYKSISKALYWTYNRNLLNGISEYLNSVDGIIYLSTFPCGPDALVNELVLRKVTSKPSLNIVLDEQDARAGLYTRLESFIDILNQKKVKVSG